MKSLRERILDAAKQIRKLKQCCPYIFPEYDELKNAKANYKHAQVRLERAKAVWRKVGNPNI